MKHCLKLTFAEVLISINSIEYCRTMDTKADRVVGKTSTAILNVLLIIVALYTK